MWCGQVRQNLVRTHSSPTISVIQHARVRVLAAEANVAVSVQIKQYAAGLVFFIVLLQHALNEVVHKFSKKKSRKYLKILGSR